MKSTHQVLQTEKRMRFKMNGSLGRRFTRILTPLVLALTLVVSSCGELPPPSLPIDHSLSHCGPFSFGNPWLIHEHFLHWTPDGSHLIFSYGRSGIWVVDADGTQVHRIVDANPGDIFEYGYYADMSPDGTKIVYSTCEFPTEGEVTYSERENYNYEIAVINLDGTGQRRLTENRTFEHYPVWSPDGSRIAYLSGDPALYELELHTMAADGTDARLVSETLGSVPFAPPVWSPDGEHLAVIASYDDSLHLFTVRVDGSKATPIAKVGYEGVGDSAKPRILPAWSPDGEYLAFVMANEVGEAEGVYTMQFDGTELRKVAEHATHVSWSPDGSELLLSLQYVIHPDGSNLRDLELSGFLNGWQHAAWSPDSTRIAIYTPGATFYTVARDGTDQRELALFSGYIVAANSDYRDATKDIAACSEGSVVPRPQENPGLVQDCQTLLVMRERLSGEVIWNWRAEVPITEWWGVEIGGSPPRVVGLSSYSLEPFLLMGGFIPPEIGDLTRLEKIAIHRLKGGFPAEMSKLTNLRELYVGEHQFDGRFSDLVPPELGKLTNLQGLGLEMALGNELAGCVRAELPEIWVEASRLERCAN